MILFQLAALSRYSRGNKTIWNVFFSPEMLKDSTKNISSTLGTKREEK